jgi:hypothetical protein
MDWEKSKKKRHLEHFLEFAPTKQFKNMKKLGKRRINCKRRRARRRKITKEHAEISRLYNTIKVNPKSSYILVCGDSDYYVSANKLTKTLKYATIFNSYTIARDIFKWRKYKVRPVNLKKFLKERHKQFQNL